MTIVQVVLESISAQDQYSLPIQIPSLLEMNASMSFIVGQLCPSTLIKMTTIVLEFLHHAPIIMVVISLENVVGL